MTIRKTIRSTIRRPYFDFVHPGSGLNYPWMELPYFSLPSTGVSLLVGQEVTIYGDELINVPIRNKLQVTYSCDIGTASGNNWTVTPIDGDIGDHSMTIKFKNNGVLIDSYTITLSVYALAPAGTKKILMIGDSLLDGAEVDYSTQLSAVLSNCTLTFLGTQGSTIKHEGYPGWKWSHFITDHDAPVSPFMKSGVLDIAAYFTDNTIDVPDYIYVMLGINDTFAHCDLRGNGLTDAEITTIINNAKTLIDAFLAYNANLKIILGIPTITENTGAGWNDSYGESIYSQDLFIQNIHKYRMAFVSAFANSAYSPRVDCSYEAILLDRDNGYPKTDGIHTNGVHPDQSGSEQLGVGMALYFNKDLKSALKPTGLAVAWENDYATIDFTDETVGTAQHEIWESKNGGAYSLVTTLDAGTVHYHNATWQNASMNFKVRAKSGIWYSEFTDAVALSTPLVWKTNQTILTSVVINALNITEGKTVNVDWGDGTNADCTGNNASITKDYGVGNEANPYYIKLSGDVNFITSFYHSAQVLSFGDLSKWILPSNIRYFNIRGCNFTGDISSWVLPTGLTSLLLNNSSANNFTGDISNWVLPANLTELYLISQIGSPYNITGDLSGATFPAGITRFYVDQQNLTGIPRGNYKNFDATIGLYAGANNCDSAEIDLLLQNMDNYFASNTPVKNSLFKLDGTGMGIPSATGLAAKAAIEAKYTAAGFTATIAVNS